MKPSFYMALLCVIGAQQTKAQDNQDLKAYNNYDFIPGEKVLFEDDFNASADGEFPPRWNLVSGQGVVNKTDRGNVFVYTEGSIGNIAKIEPAMKSRSYLGESFTVEFDLLLPGEDEVFEMMYRLKDDDLKFLSLNYEGELATNYFDADLKGIYSGGSDNFRGKWHHIALAYRKQQIKCYIDQYRVLVIPKCGFEPLSLYFGGNEKTRITHVKLADGGGMNMLGKILTDGKFITHAITFESGKSVVKGESMGFLNELALWLKANSTVKVEIGGHTDADGDDAQNLKLSEQRAEAVKKILLSLGAEASRLQTKGYGESKPMDSNASPEGKANNRRVEFIKI